MRHTQFILDTKIQCLKYSIIYYYYLLVLRKSVLVLEIIFEELFYFITILFNTINYTVSLKDSYIYGSEFLILQIIQNLA